MTSPTAERRLLVVEDDGALRDTLAYNLRSEGYTVETARDGVEGLDKARQHPPDLVLLDLMLPRLDGLEVCRQLRSRPETADCAILMLTARDSETDTVVGLELGADDYVAKPYAWNELRARIRALLRRGGQAAGQATRAENPIIEGGGLRINLDRHEVTRHGEPVQLATRLFDLLVYLMRNAGSVLTRDRLLQNVWGYDYEGDTRTIDVHIRWLREKVEDDPANPQLIQTVRGVGYRFRG